MRWSECRSVDVWCKERGKNRIRHEILSWQIRGTFHSVNSGFKKLAWCKRIENRPGESREKHPWTGAARSIPNRRDDCSSGNSMRLNKDCAGTGWWGPGRREASAIFCLTWYGKEHPQLHGYACYGPTPLTQGVYDLYWIVVDPQLSGKGFGRYLLEYVSGIS